MSITRAATLGELEQAGHLVDQHIRPDGTFGGWNGREVLCHLAAYARLVGATLHSVAENRPSTEIELYRRELTDQERALTDLDAVNDAVQREYAALSYSDALIFWRTMHARAIDELTRLTDEQLAAPGPSSPPNWWRPHVAEVVTALAQHYRAHLEPEHK